ncbi:MAG TPA: CYCXC family (seleno)protein [Longimicrobiales bacterium]|nr:CYCXC family (seleno)protein [Longimicrobiales bacterium]
MSRASRRRAGRGGQRVGSRGSNRAPLWIMSGSVLAALLVLAAVTQRGREPASHHPTPRLDAHAAHVMPAARYAQSPGVQEVYEMAAEIPAVLDGLYCYCFCNQTFGHYSLLDCFRDDHGAGCDVCLNEAVIAYEMTKQGSSLEDIRQAVDGRYRT